MFVSAALLNSTVVNNALNIFKLIYEVNLIKLLRKRITHDLSYFMIHCNVKSLLSPLTSI